MPAPDTNPFKHETDNQWRNTMPETEYDWMRPFPASAPDDVRFLIDTCAVWLGTDGAPETLAEFAELAGRYAQGGDCSPSLPELFCGWLSDGEAVATLTEGHSAALVLAPIALHPGAYLDATDPFHAVLITHLEDGNSLDVLSEISALCVRAASLTAAADDEITAWFTAWQASDMGRITLAWISRLASAFAALAESGTDTGAEI